MKKVLSGIIVLVLVLFGVIWWLATNQAELGNSAEDSATLEVATSFYVLEHFISEVGGDQVAFVFDAPNGIDAHTYEPASRDVARMYDADLFMYHGAGLDPWAKKLAGELEKSGVTVLAITDKMTLLEADHADENAEDEHEVDEPEDEDEHGTYDPHIWLDPMRAIEEVKIIRDLLQTMDPEHATTYATNTKNYIAELAQLDKEFVDGLADCKKNDIIVAHDAFTYMALRYDITMHAIAGISPEEEPSARKIAELATLAEEQELEYIFFESLTSPRLADTLATEVGAKTLVLNPIEGLTTEEQEQGEDYLSVMRTNLQNLRTALECQ